jgi:hypothetical protein
MITPYAPTRVSPGDFDLGGSSNIQALDLLEAMHKKGATAPFGRILPMLERAMLGRQASQALQESLRTDSDPFQSPGAVVCQGHVEKPGDAAQVALLYSAYLRMQGRYVAWQSCTASISCCKPTRTGRWKTEIWWPVSGLIEEVGLYGDQAENGPPTSEQQVGWRACAQDAGCDYCGWSSISTISACFSAAGSSGTTSIRIR